MDLAGILRNMEKHLRAQGVSERFLTRELERGLEGLFEGWVEVPRIRHGSRQIVGTLINEEAQLLAKYLREELKTWVPRISF